VAYDENRPGDYVSQAVENLIADLGLVPQDTKTITIHLDAIEVESFSRNDKGDKYIQPNGYVAMERKRIIHSAYSTDMHF
jgi:hypothetical protein